LTRRLFPSVEEEVAVMVQKQLAFDILQYLKTNEVDFFVMLKNLPYSDDAIFECVGERHKNLFSSRNEIKPRKTEMICDSDVLIKASDKGLDFFFENATLKSKPL
jgi:hypothetical protein